MKIKKLQIKNFQAHKDTTLEFDEGLNVITGATNTGKSSILRALKKVIRDTPGGNNFVNIDEKECVISVETENNEITRHIAISSKGDTKTNEYILNDELFAKFGKEVPIEIIRALRMPEIDFDSIKVDLNFADQLEGPFLLSSTPSLKAKVLGKLSGVDVLDRAIIQTNKCLRKTSNEVKSDTVSIEKLNQELSEFIDISKCEKELDDLNQSLNKIEQDLLLLEKLKGFKNSLDDVVKRGKKIKKDLENLEIVGTINFDTIEKDFILFQKIKELSVQTIDLNIKEEILQTKIKYLQILVSQETNFDSIESDLECLKRVCDFEKQLVIFEKVEKCEKNVENLNISVGSKVEELKKFLTDLKVCPTCNQTLSENVIEKMI
ncbi:MAG: AAA family ATPase [Candidatus Cloacimonetes bacterium]|nr:AAA family ATPase [Candidatus Cloacimonadota bacterium]